MDAIISKKENNNTYSQPRTSICKKKLSIAESTRQQAIMLTKSPDPLSELETLPAPSQDAAQPSEVAKKKSLKMRRRKKRSPNREASDDEDDDDDGTQRRRDEQRDTGSDGEYFESMDPLYNPFNDEQSINAGFKVGVAEDRNTRHRRTMEVCFAIEVVVVGGWLMLYFLVLGCSQCHLQL